MSKKFFSQRKAAAHLGIAPSTLGTYVRKGIAPPHLNFHGTRKFAVSDLDAWLAAHKVGGA